MSENACPLCQRTKPMRKAKPLYGTLVCKKCYHGFANRRQGAYLIDALLWWPIATGLSFGVGAALLAVQATQEATIAVNIAAGWILLPMVFFLKDGFGGHSPGKAICGVVAVDPETHQPIGFGKAWRRNLPLLIPFVVLIIAFQLCRGYRWGDRWSGSKVIWKKYCGHRVFTGQLTCERCQYDLRGNTSGFCSECGHPVPRGISDHGLEPVGAGSGGDVES